MVRSSIDGKSLCRSLVCLLLTCGGSALAAQESVVPTAGAPRRLRVGMIGLDTSHVSAFARILNDPAAAADVSDCAVVAASPAGSDLPFALERQKRYVAELEAMGVEMVASIEDLLVRVDAVMLMTVDGRPHLRQARPVLESGKPLFIDKPLAGSLVDAVRLLHLASEHAAPVFTASSLRYTPGVQAVRAGSLGEVLGADAYSPCTLEPHHPDLFWYGIHGVELLFTAMGRGCDRVSRTHTEATDVVVGTWADGRIGTFRGLRAVDSGYGGTAFGSKGVGALGPYTGYRPLVVEIVRFFRTRVAPVDAAESLEIFAFMEAADESKRRGGAAVSLAEVLQRARQQAGLK